MMRQPEINLDYFVKPCGSLKNQPYFQAAYCARWKPCPFVPQSIIVLNLSRFCVKLIAEQQAGEFANNTLPDYLAALASFAEDYDGFCVRLADAPSPEIASWQAFADMLAAEVVYE